MKRCARVWLLLACLKVSAAQAITLSFDYSIDQANHNWFGSHPAAQSLLDNVVAPFFSSRLDDDLAAVQYSGFQSYQVEICPASYCGSAVAAAVDVNVAADEIKIFVGGASLGGNSLGLGGPSWFVSPQRGEVGHAGSPPASDFEPWFGTISFDMSHNWYFDNDVSTADTPFSEFDFFSVAVHEVLHVLGIGTAPSWASQISNGYFIGLASTALYGGPVPLAGSGHFFYGISSSIDGSGSYEVAMDPDIASGQQKQMTDLDWAALEDIGWQVNTAVVPLPPAAAMYLSALLLLRAPRALASVAVRRVFSFARLAPVAVPAVVR